jgi:23S rRNA (guanine745-N1)-methyltransferase
VCWYGFFALADPYAKGSTMTAESTFLTCPHCLMTLDRNTSDYFCHNRHTFPIAREGYVNLLGRTYAGDTTPMLAARRRFLDAGYFLPIAKAIAGELVQYAPFHRLATLPSSIIDAGCGEGYYLNYVQRTLATTALSIQLVYYGFDSAKAAVKLAARRCRAATFFVGDITRRWLVSTTSSCAILNIFAPRNYAEAARVLQQHGLFLSVIPTQRHLQEVRALYHLLTIEKQKEARIRAQAKPWFSLVHTQTIEYEQQLTRSAIADAVFMSPSYWHQSKASGLVNDEQDMRSITVSVQLLILQRI